MKSSATAFYNDVSVQPRVDIPRDPDGGECWRECRSEPELTHGWRPLAGTGEKASASAAETFVDGLKAAGGLPPLLGVADQ